MSVARTADLASRPSLPAGSAARPGTGAHPVLLAAIAALALALLGAAYARFGFAPVDGYPDPTQQWTD